MNKETKIPLAAIESARELRGMHGLNVMPELITAHLENGVSAEIAKLSEIDGAHQKTVEAIESVASEMTNNFEVVSIEIGHNGEANVEMRIAPGKTLDYIQIEFVIEKDECPICVFEERFHALMDEVE